MISALEWNPVLPMVPLLLASIGALALLLAIEWRRKQRFKAARLGCQFLIAVCLFGLLARPSMNTRFPAGPLLVLTPGYNASTIDSLSSAFPDLSVVSVPDVDEPRARKLPSVRSLDSIAGNPLWIAGHGLPAYALSDLSTDFRFIPAAPATGIIDLVLPARIVTGVPVMIRGAYHSESATPTIIKLVGPGGVEDSTAIVKAGNASFEMTLLPAIAGSLMYKLEEVDSAGQVFRSSRLPIHAQEQRTLDVLIVSDYPTFELRYLKNFLADKGHKVSMRNRLSRDRFHQEFANRPSINLHTLTPSLLASADVLIVDQASFAGMPASERNQVIRSMHSGLGIVFLPTTATKSTRQLITLSPIERARDTVRLQISGIRYTLPAVRLNAVEDVLPITIAEEGRIVAGCRCTGELRVGFQLLRETYQLGLQGKANSYAALWTPLLEKVARERDTGFRISLDQQFPVFSNEPHDFTVVSSGATPQVIFDALEIPSTENAFVDGLWHGKIWTDGNRWHTVQVDSSNMHFFDLPTNEWAPLRTARQLTVNLNHRGQSGHESTIAQRRSWPMAFFVLFVLASGFLWLAPKI